MALRSQSLFLYGLQVTAKNSSIDFQAVNSGPILQASIVQGYYSLTALLLAVQSAMQAVDPAHQYTITADRTISGGTQNRITIKTSGAFLSLLWASGPRAASAASNLLGFVQTDRTGATQYTGTFSCGTPLVPAMIGYNYVPPTKLQKYIGMVNISASGIKEALTFSIQQFLECQFMYIEEGEAENGWVPFFQWAAQQLPFEMIPEIDHPTVYYPLTLEMTTEDGKGMGFRLKELLGEGIPFEWDTGLFKCRITKQ